jgi:hypothetical protein
MKQADLKTTLAISPCWSCRAGIPEEQNFCRWCGANQNDSDPATVTVRVGVAAEPDGAAKYVTTRLDKQTLYHPVSAPLVRAVVQGLPDVSHTSAGTLTKRMLLALMTVPIWVMIILLSPLDAYTSAKVIARRI